VSRRFLMRVRIPSRERETTRQWEVRTMTDGGLKPLTKKTLCSRNCSEFVLDSSRWLDTTARM